MNIAVRTDRNVCRPFAFCRGSSVLATYSSSGEIRVQGGVLVCLAQRVCGVRFCLICRKSTRVPRNGV